MQEINLPSLDPEQFAPVLEPAQAQDFLRTLSAAASTLGGRTFWHVNSTASGGGVAEMLRSVLCYLRGGGVNARWAVMDGDDEFFVLTKRIHHFLHGSPGDGGPLGDSERACYLKTVDREARTFAKMVGPRDVVVLHDPQTLGFVPLLWALRVPVIWNCHVGVDEPNEWARRVWQFLAPDANLADRVVFSRGRYTWDVLDRSSVAVIPPCIDAFSPKNQQLDDAAVSAILNRAAIVPGDGAAPPAFARQDGSAAVVGSTAKMIEERRLSPDDVLVTQISRWDPLKDHRGVMEGFCRDVPEALGAQLVLAGPSPESIADDPEGGQTLDELSEAWAQLPEAWRQRVHIACLPMDDLEENAAIVNALQRRSAVIVQKSLAEGFGLTVAEAMWKGVPTVGSAVGGIQDQIEHGISGVLLEDPGDLTALGEAVTGLLEEPEKAHALGRRAHCSVRDNYLAPCYLVRFLDLATALV